MEAFVVAAVGSTTVAAVARIVAESESEILEHRREQLEVEVVVVDDTEVADNLDSS